MANVNNFEPKQREDITQSTMYEDMKRKRTLIYIYSAESYEDHKGLVKIGKANFDTYDPDYELTPNCEKLNTPAHKRIKQEVGTAGFKYELRYTELAWIDGVYTSFDDKDVHKVLNNSGYYSHSFGPDSSAQEWFKVPLETAICAIKAVKEGRTQLNDDEKVLGTATAGTPLLVNADRGTLEKKSDKKEIKLREEQRNAVEKARHVFERFLKAQAEGKKTPEELEKSDDRRFLWDCKMRFGKTLSAYELVRQMRLQKVLVVTHRPVVKAGWKEDHDKIFSKENYNHHYYDKTMAPNKMIDGVLDRDFEAMLKNADRRGEHFIYFASQQDLRGSDEAGGKFAKNKAVFNLDWDLIIYDEVHEGLATDLGEKVTALLEEPRQGKFPLVLSMSGTPYEISKKFNEGHTFSWTYVDEQTAKERFYAEHPNEPNPYANLPQLRILTFDLSEDLPEAYKFTSLNSAFSFSEFFRVYTGDPKKDHGVLREEEQYKIGHFVHEDSVKKFLNLISEGEENSNYPFVTAENRKLFCHTFWILPGTKEAKALSAMLKEHRVFYDYEIINVAGDGDEERPFDDALKLVQKGIKEHEKTITLSCGRLTAGVTVPQWNAVMLLSGSDSASAENYMQTIFRVQSPGTVNGEPKRTAYAFDFAPDRTLKVIGAVHAKKQKGKDELSAPEFRQALGRFLNFAPIIAVNGSTMEDLDVKALVRKIKTAQVEKAVETGFEDNSVYKSLDDFFEAGHSEEDNEFFKKLSNILTKQNKSKNQKEVKVNEQKYNDKQYEEARKKPKKQLTPEDEEALKEKKERQKQRNNAIALLRSVAIRLPLLIYGADNFEWTEKSHMADFAGTGADGKPVVDDESWMEFMPQGLTREVFKELTRYFDEDVVVEASRRIRERTHAVDELPPTQRTREIAKILMGFKNPDKETVLTPWRVVNMHMVNTIGGYNFFDENFKNPLTDGEPPNLVEQPVFGPNGGNVTANVYTGTKDYKDVKILEMNSKSGIYPLYLAYNLYALNNTADDATDSELEFQQALDCWNEALSHVYVLCKTKMAEKITRRTLCGYNKNFKCNTLYIPKLVETMQKNYKDEYGESHTRTEKEVKENYHRLANKIRNVDNWQSGKNNPNTQSLKKETEHMKFNAIVGNPPYQQSDGGHGTSAGAVYNFFVNLAKEINPSYISFIMPARWYVGGKGLDEFRAQMLNDKHLTTLHDFPNDKDVFEGVDIAGGLCYFLWEADKESENCNVITHDKESQTKSYRKLNEFDIFVRDKKALNIIHKIFRVENYDKCLNNRVYSRKSFGISTNYSPREKGTPCYFTQKQGKQFANPKDITDAENILNKWKFIAPKAPIAGQTNFNKPVGFYYDGNVKVAKPGECCTESWLVLGAFDTEKEVLSYRSYILTKTVRFLLLQAVMSQNTSKECFKFIPDLGKYDQEYTDEILRKRWDITTEEWNYIDSRIHNYDKLI